MGGEGSGRKPSVETILKQSHQNNTQTGDGIFLPNYSGVKTSSLKTSGESAGSAPDNAKYIVQTSNATLSAEQVLADLATGMVKNTTTTGVLSIGTEGTDYYKPTGTDVSIADGGTGVSTSAAALVALGVEIGVDVQAYDAQLADVAGLTPTDNGVIIGNGTNFVVEEGATLKTSLGLTIGTNVQAYDADLTTWAGITPGTGVGTFLATPSSANLLAAVTDETGTGPLVFGYSPTISGGTITGITDLVVADGGTGVSTLGDAGVLIGNGTGAIQATAAGTAGQVLTSNGAGVDPTFQAAGGGDVDLIATATTTNDTTNTITFSSIATGYKHFKAVCNWRVSGGTLTDGRLTLNNDTSGVYNNRMLNVATTTVSAGGNTAVGYYHFDDVQNMEADGSYKIAIFEISNQNYAQCSKGIRSSMQYSPVIMNYGIGEWDNKTTEINRIDFIFNTASRYIASGSYIALYGFK